MDLSFLPAVNAALNGLAGAMLVTAVVLIKRRKIAAHRAMMLAAFATSCLFLVSYLTYHAWTGGRPTRFNGAGLARVLYFSILVSHTILAAIVPFLAIGMIRLGLLRRDATHRRLARFAFPIWLYVSVTGVLIYVMLYHLNPRG